MAEAHAVYFLLLQYLRVLSFGSLYWLFWGGQLYWRKIGFTEDDQWIRLLSGNKKNEQHVRDTLDLLKDEMKKADVRGLLGAHVKFTVIQ